ncbi:zinc-binding dehydrogenase [Nonomuraea gerenzanensis]|uniref:Alcohol dehydrogenase, zinc-binding n=1 Tax=Nonomuraea gerenzanensis TaxID=93944 RepID=A0A1M4E9R9_9ACTN|nr:zinc-binding dehydrogenase [Nonomuraea gerenzanensis]UBU17861.1 zinc-binding dehydrogenase [Nonomuraea gerenzanensis]SBO95651.1 Alcohol dehydrogenase, zinc-binding [Nonomuraea gerenzanensis]
MRQILVNRFGGPEVLELDKAPDLVPGPGQVVVGISAADIIFLDTLLRSGAGKDYFPLRPPYVPGHGGAGLVTAVGDGVDPAWTGRRVAVGTSGGGYAEQVAVAVEELTPIPDGLGLAEAAALLHDGPTAVNITDAAEIKEGARVLVTAAAGGTGLLVVQLARAAGARVIAAARGARKLELAREVGAEEAFDYTEAGWIDRVRAATGGDGVDVVLDGAGGPLGGEAFEAVAHGGRFVSYGTSSGFAQVDPDTARQRGIRTISLMDLNGSAAGKTEELVGRALALAADGRLRPVIGQTFPLEQAADAHAAITARDALGKTLLLL